MASKKQLQERIHELEEALFRSERECSHSSSDDGNQGHCIFISKERKIKNCSGRPKSDVIVIILFKVPCSSHLKKKRFSKCYFGYL